MSTRDRFMIEQDIASEDIITIRPTGTGTAQIYISRQTWAPQSAIYTETPILDYSRHRGFQMMHPINVYRSAEEIVFKYEPIKDILIFNSDSEEHDYYFDEANDRNADVSHDEVFHYLNKLPKSFTKNPIYGLGLIKEFSPLITAITNLRPVEHLVIGCKESNYSEELNSFFISYKDLEVVRKTLNRIHGHATKASREVRATTAYNFVARILGVPETEPKYGRDPYRQLFTKLALGDTELSVADNRQLMDAVGVQVRDIAKKDPLRLSKLKDDIETAALEVVIQQFEGLLDRPAQENEWQKLFSERPFILSMLFGYPLISIQEQAHIGGQKITGAGGKITDFIAKNGLTNNLALIEIKTPLTPLLNIKKPYRNGVYAPSTDLSGSINQVLDQRYQLQRTISYVKDTNSLTDVESYSIHCCLIVGKLPVDKEQNKSFELFRRNSKDVEIVTFDEILEKMKHLLNLLRPGKEIAAKVSSKNPENIVLF